MFTLLGPIVDAANSLSNAINAALNSPIADAITGLAWLYAAVVSAVVVITN